MQGKINKAIVMKKELDQVIDYIYDNLDNPPTLAQLAQFTGLSESYFQRRFLAQYGISADALQRLLRLRRAAWQLAFRPRQSITDIACDAGFESVAAFSKSFRRHCGLTPSDFRANPDWDYWKSLETPLAGLRTKHNDDIEFTPESAKLVAFPSLTLSGIHHQADVVTLAKTLRQLINWRQAHGVSPPRSRTFNIFLAPPTPGHLDIFVGATNGAGKPLEAGMRHYVLPAMACLTLPFTGNETAMGRAMARLAEEAGGCLCHPPFIERVRWFPDVPEEEAEYRLYAPVKLS